MTRRTPHRPGRKAVALAGLLASVLALAGCGNLVPPREAPSATLPGSFRSGPPADAPLGDAQAAHEWAGFFVDERLRRVVGLALEGNRSLRASVAAVERARAQAGLASAARLPALDGTASASRQRSGGNVSGSSGLSLGVSAWEIDLFDRLGSLEGAALARYLGQQETQRSARLSLVAEVATAWLALAAEQQRLRLAEAVRDSQQRTLALTERQYQLGAASGLDRARAQTAFEAARGEVARSQAVVQQARLALELLAGQPLAPALLPSAGPLPATAATPGTGAAGATTSGPPVRAPSGGAEALADAVTALPDLPPGLPAEVLLQRPDLRAAEQALDAAAYNVGAARAARFPRLTLTGSAGTRSADLDGLIGGGSFVWSLLPSLQVPLFDAGARQAQVEANEATRREALAQYEAALQAAFREVADALTVRDSLAERLAAQQAQVDAAERSASLAEQRYRLGAISQLELLDAQRQLTTAQQGLVTLRQTEQVNRVVLLRVLGGRWRIAL